MGAKRQEINWLGKLVAVLTLALAACSLFANYSKQVEWAIFCEVPNGGDDVNWVTPWLEEAWYQHDRLECDLGYDCKVIDMVYPEIEPFDRPADCSEDAGWRKKGTKHD